MLILLFCAQSPAWAGIPAMDIPRTVINKAENLLDIQRFKEKVEKYKAKLESVSKVAGLETDAQNTQEANKVLRTTQVMTDTHNKQVSAQQQAAPGACEHVDAAVKAAQARDEANCFSADTFKGMDDVAGIMHGTLERDNVNLNLDYILGKSSGGTGLKTSGGITAQGRGAASTRPRSAVDTMRSEIVRKMLSYQIAAGKVQAADVPWVTGADRSRFAQSTKESLANEALLLTDPGVLMSPDRFLTYTMEQQLSARQSAFLVANPKMLTMDTRRGDDTSANVARVGGLQKVLVANTAYKTLVHLASLRVQPGQGKPSYLDGISYYGESAFEGPVLRRVAGTDPNVSLQALQRDQAAYDGYRVHMAVAQFREALNQEVLLAFRLAHRINGGR